VPSAELEGVPPAEPSAGFALSNAVSSSPRSRPRFTTVILAAPASAASTAIARAAPPAPRITSDFPAGSTTVRSAAMKPWPSVFSPIQAPSRDTAVLTAPITAADSPRPSRCSITATL
jgi:hypothetical protein